MKLVLIYLLTTFPIMSYAYLDPASGSAVFYLIATLFTSCFFMAKNFFISTFARLRLIVTGESKSASENNIVFYSEGAHYWQVFQPIIEELVKSGEKVTYLTSAKNDQGLRCGIDQLTAKYIGSPLVACSYLNNMKANFLGLTTPQLDVFNLKRSKNVKHYAHIIHAPIDIHLYRKFAFDYFDSIFCSGPHQEKSLKALESVRPIPPKKILATGLTYLDYLMEKKNQIQTRDKKKAVLLIAPSWKEHCILNQIGFDLIENLLTSEFDILLRPHPQSYTSFPDVIRKIEEQFSSSIEIDRSPDPLYALNLCDMMISDLSGIIWDFIYLYEKPILLFDPQWDLKGFEGTEIAHQAWDIKTIEKHIPKFQKRDIPNIQEIVKSTSHNFKPQVYQQIKDESLYSIGNTGAVAAKQIKEIVSQII